MQSFIKAFGEEKPCYCPWTRLTGYHARRRIEAQMQRLNSFGERIASKDPNRQAAEIHTRIALMNHFSAMERAQIGRHS